MSKLACAVARCAIPRRHRDGCENEQCRGCLRALAAPGLRLCDLHTTRIATDALRCAELDHEIEQVLASYGRRDERTSGSATHGTVIDERAMAVRTEIRHTLASWCRLIAEERGIGLPPDHLDAIAAYVATHHEWLAAHPAAGDCSDELSGLQRRAWAVAYPTGARVFPVGPCPTTGCGATVRVVLRVIDSLLPSELVCDGTHVEGCDCGRCPPHRWPYTSWRNLGRKISQRYLTPAEIAEEWSMPIGTVRWYASRHRWRRAEDGRRPALYLAVDVRATLDVETITNDDPNSVCAP